MTRVGEPPGVPQDDPQSGRWTLDKLRRDQLMSARFWAAGVPLNEALGVFRFRGQSEGGLTVTEVRRA